ncbi:hypothetical protein ET475_09165 [Microbacterium protaetiae]|uniref:DUF998 domain-containing protein n=1 Tax=Microbacterium protaetiae TaxID=2509458 RepID=A0A4P6EFF8_9MICO|nr:hypothetical protein [Microbacterium protaetiae]QAY60143.1 hypothetical protein ET475_09165 [Microbacterium protaetiae]
MKTFLQTLSLAVASAVTAEFLLGDQYLGGTAPAGQQIAELILFTAFYGSAAVLIRELARRARIGWPGILLLALAFGVLEEGVLTQSLFNPDYVGAHLLSYGFVPWLGTAGPWLVFVLTLHVVWSIGSPIAVMEGAYGDRPWIRHAGWLAVPAALFVFGATAILAFSGLTSGYWETAAELIVSLLIVAALVVGAFVVVPRVQRRRERVQGTGAGTRNRRHVGYGWALLVGIVLSSAFQLLDQLPHEYSAWIATLALLVVLGIGITFAVRLRPDAVGFASGAILTYGWVGLVNGARAGTPAVIEQVVLVAIALAVLAVVGVRRVRAEGSNTVFG